MFTTVWTRTTALAAVALIASAVGVPAQVLTGSYTGDGTDGRAITAVGFTPSMVIVQGLGATPPVCRTATMPGDAAKALSGSQSLRPNRIEGFLPDGFTVGSDSLVNAPNITYHWIAFFAVPEEMTVGTYLGDDTEYRAIAGLGFRPDYVMVLGELDEEVWHRPASMLGEFSLPYDRDKAALNRIQGLLIDGFEVGEHPAVNLQGITYHWAAWRAVPGQMTVGNYVGDGTADRAITGLGLAPAFVLVKPDAEIIGTHRPASLGTENLTFPCTAAAAFPDGIVELLADGFRIGARSEINSMAKSFFFAAFAAGHPSTADARLLQSAAPSAVDAADTVLFTLTVSNAGPANLSNIVILDLLPVALEFLAATPERGVFDQASGLWQVGALTNGSSATLALLGRVKEGLAGTTIVNDAVVVYADLADPDLDNNRAAATVRVRSADLHLSIGLDPTTVAEGDSAVFTLELRNDGPDPAWGVAVTDTLPAGLLLAGAEADAGSYAADTGIWTVGDLGAGAEAALRVTVVAAAGTDGLELVNACAAAAEIPGDADPTDNQAATVLRVADPTVEVRAVPLAVQTGVPGGGGGGVCRFELTGASAPDTLRALALTNVTVSEGSEAQRDAEWASLRLWLATGGTLSPPPTAPPGQTTSTLCTMGRAVFEGLAVPITPGDTLSLVVEGAASLLARDGETLSMALAAQADLEFSGRLEARGAWPLTSGGGLAVDGMVAAQVDLAPVLADALPAGCRHRLVLDVVLPPNGWAADRLEMLGVANLGSAAPLTDLESLEAWLDDGDCVFDPSRDPRLGNLSFTGDRWALSGLDLSIPSAGQRVFVSANIAADAVEGRTVRVSLPASPYVAIGMASGNDGPLDRDVANPEALTISPDTPLLATATALATGQTAPGQRDLPLLQFVVANTDTVSRRLVSLTCTNLAASPIGGSAPQLDGELEQLRLRLDGDGDGLLTDLDVDPILGTTAFADGLACFAGLSVECLPGTSRRLLLVGDVSLLDAADGDVLGTAIMTPDHLVFEPPVPATANWPLDSGARWTVDGLLAAQILASPAPAVALGPGDGPALALDVILPANGYAEDVLERLTVVNLGNATPGDIGELRLWRDGGDGVFSGDGGDDTALAPLTWYEDSWQTPGLAEPLAPAGTRLFVAVTASETPADSATVRLALPVGGIVNASANDGPRDVAVASPGFLLLSTAPLLAELTLGASASTLGQTVEVTMAVRNEGTEDLLAVTPSALAAEGNGILRVTGPDPAPLDLPVGQVAVFRWTCVAEGVGEVILSGSAAGVGAVDGVIRRSFQAIANPHQVFAPAQDLGLYATTNLPFAVLRGQEDVVPLTLTLVNPAGADASDIRLRGLRVRIEDAAGAGIAPAAIFSRVVVSEGTVTYLDRVALETTGDELDLTLARPALVTTSEPTTISLRLDISPDTVVPEFRVVVVDSTVFSTEDAVSGAPVAVSLLAGTYPIQSGLGLVLEAAPALTVAGIPLPERTAGPGQVDVPLLAAELANPGLPDIAGDVLVNAFALALTDTSGTLLPQPNQWLQRVRVRAGATLLLERELGALDDSLLVIELPAPLAVAAGAPVPLAVSADLTGDAPPIACRARLGPASLVEAADRNTGLPVPVVYLTDPVDGGTILIELPATRLLAAGVPGLSQVLTIGARDVTALGVLLTHPGPPLSANIRCDTLSVVCLDQARRRLPPGAYLDRVRLLRAGSELASLAVSPDAIGPLTLPMGGLTLAPGETVALSLVIDVDASAPLGTLELVVMADGVTARDANLGSLVTLEPDAGAVLPLSSGLTQLEPPAELLTVTLVSRLPTVLAGGEADVPVATLLFANPAPAGSGAVTISALRLRASARDGTNCLVGAAVAEVLARLGEEVWAVATTLSPSDTFAVLQLSEPLAVEAGQAVEIALSASFAPHPTLESLRLGLDEGDVGVAQPDGALLAVRVAPPDGAQFPLWTTAGGFLAASLRESFANYRNPFAAGREATTFVFVLPADAAVSLRVLTPRGETVIDLLENAALAAGPHRNIVWDGRNGRGATVANGVYVAELTARFVDGSSERILRKVAVVR